jgi:DnaJ homolog subfamily C member 17
MSDELPSNFDIYAFLSIPPTATEAEIRKAYRKQSLLYHPDKNPAPSAVEKFHYLNLSLDILVSPAARAAYDNVRKARAAKAERTAKYDDERRRMQRDLESREQDAKRRKLGQHKKTDVEEDFNLREAVEKLKEESARLKRARDKKLQEESAKQDDKEEDIDESERTLKVRFRKGIDRESLSIQKLEEIFSEFGTIQNVILGKSALVVFENLAAAKKALNELSRSNASDLSFIKEITMARTVAPENGPSPKTQEDSSHKEAAMTKPVISTIPAAKHTKFSFKPPSATGNDADYESITLMRMRKIERERLEREILEQEEKEDGDSVLVS